MSKFGGNKTYSRYTDIVTDYASGALFPLDLKNALTEWLVKKLEPARTYFENPEMAKNLAKK